MHRIEKQQKDRGPNSYLAEKQNTGMDFDYVQYKAANNEEDSYLQTKYYDSSVTRKWKKPRRFLEKDGTCNVVFKHIDGEWGGYVHDIYTTLVDIKWRLMFLIFSLSYVLSWLFFGLVFWITAVLHGDLQNNEDSLCVENVRSFVGAFLFSLETQTTIGYGSRYVTQECPAAILTVIFQSVLSCLIDAFIIGAALTKMATARKRSHTVGFSNNAVIAMRDGKLCFMCRLGDFRQNHMVEGKVRVQLLKKKIHSNNGVIVEYHDLELVNDEIILATPVTIIHEINKKSPLYRLSKRDFAREDFEILMTFAHTCDSTGISHQSRSSYLPQEILWGHRFKEILRAKVDSYKVDYSLFDQTSTVRIPICSAQEVEKKGETNEFNSVCLNGNPMATCSTMLPFERNALDQRYTASSDNLFAKNTDIEEYLKPVVTLTEISQETQI
ncbi:inward rectifier potassium channel 16-like [Protopterus annectens]|uniref:inward rectifier potassium channel 16-like n=1 Tax=Protopterus annectens TaxID=7888 RepID=UPI001CFB779C|nr:inward rectifier potassium channel 16-like [Protopterus annectens]XP_043941090.1 inward rectifier potassium channel 16-like [Protopterus annectens]XP_043941092.1 inward rectifier potassium channel 16-like [Protopterus annectens]XP_043941093.1 inward rectifier potassium channel 16-like [Protopterus annectens]XP_043941094.1 inward rectifier potassium channel 16-like [Protopterus annectens]